MTTLLLRLEFQHYDNTGSVGAHGVPIILGPGDFENPKIIGDIVSELTRETVVRFGDVHFGVNR